jgi:Family of unknown function (DUF5996)
VSFPLYGHSVASSYRDTVQALAALGVQVHIDKPTPFDLPGAGRPFADDTEHGAYNPVGVTFVLAGAQSAGRGVGGVRCSTSTKVPTKPGA